MHILNARVIFKDGKSNNEKVQFEKNYILIPVKKLGDLRDTLHRFPPILEYVVQTIQRYFSNYVYEDLSRPPSYDSPDFGMNHSQFATKVNKTRRRYRSVTLN